MAAGMSEAEARETAEYDYEIEQWRNSGSNLIYKPLVPDSLKDIYPKEYSENKVYDESDDDSTKETIFK